MGREASGAIKGSCRAGRKDLSVVELMGATEDTFVQFGGHSQSGGFTVKEDAVFFLEERLSNTLRALGDQNRESIPTLADAALLPDDATTELLLRLERFALLAWETQSRCLRYKT